MRSWTYQEALDKVEDDLDLREENFIGDAEMMALFNEAIDEAEAEIHKLEVEDEYFTNSTMLAMVVGAGTIALPADIYAAKIRKLIFSDSDGIYEIRRLRGPNKFVQYRDLILNAPEADYRYLMKNVSASAGMTINLAPYARVTSSLLLECWYIRNANRITTGTDIFDIPEGMDFIFAYVKGWCKAKENLGQLLPSDAAVIQFERTCLIDTLTEMVPDEDTSIVPDTSHYEDSI